MAAKSDVELIIRAKNEASGELGKVNKALSELADHQKIVTESAKNADSTLGKLGDEFAKLQTNVKNLQSLGKIATALEAATQAIIRQRAAVSEASDEYAQLDARQKALQTQSKQLAGSLDSAVSALEKEAAALKTVKAEARDATTENKQLANEQRQLGVSLASVAAKMEKQSAAVTEQANKQALLKTTLEGTEKPTKRLVASYEAATRALERKQAALDASVARENELKAALAKVNDALAGNQAKLEATAQAVTRQAGAVDAAKSSVGQLKLQANDLASSQSTLTQALGKSEQAVARQAASLDRAQAEYRELEGIAEQAKASVGASGVSISEAGASASKAAVQLATLGARLKALQSGQSGSRQGPIFDVSGLQDTIAKITVAGVTIRAAGNDAAKSSVSMRELKTAARDVGNSAKDLDAIAIALSNQQSAAVGAKASWYAARAEVIRLAKAMKEAGTPSEALAQAFGKAQANTRLAKDEFLKQSTAATNMGAAMKAAGFGTGTLDSALGAIQPQLVRASELINRSTSAISNFERSGRSSGSGIKQTGDAMAGVGTEAAASASKVDTFARALHGASNAAGSSMGIFGKLRSEFVALVGTVVGLQQVKTFLEGVVKAGNDLAANEAKFATAFGSVAEGNKELQYARTVATNLRLPIDSLTKSYADLAIASKGTKLEGEGARKVFTAFAQVARVNRMSTSQLEGTFLALTQIMSKGKVGAEELRQQLGDRFPGAMQLMAKGIGVSVEQLDKMMEKGQLTREALVNMAGEASARVFPELAKSIDSPQAKMVAFDNAVQQFKERVANSGFLDALGDALLKIAYALSTPEAVQGAKDLGKALSDLIGILTEVSKHTDELKTAFTILFQLWAANKIAQLIASLAGLAAGLRATATAAEVATVAARTFSRALGIIGLALIALDLAGWAAEQYPAFGEGLIKLKNLALNAWDAIVEAWELAGAKLGKLFALRIAQIKEMFTGLKAWVASGMTGDALSAVGLSDWVSTQKQDAEAAAADRIRIEGELQAEMEAIRKKFAGSELARQKQLEDELAAYRKRKAGESKPDDKPKPDTPPTDTTTGTTLVTAGSPFVPDGTKAAEAAAKKRKQLEQQLANEMYTIRAQMAKKSADDEEEQLAAVRVKYQKTFDLLKQLGKDQTSQEWKDVEALIAAEQQQIRVTNAKKAQIQADKDAAEQRRSEREAMEYVNSLLTTRQSIQEQLKRARDQGDEDEVVELSNNLVIATQRAQDAINGMKAYWQAVGGPEADIALAKLDALQLKLTKTGQKSILTAANVGKAFGSAMSAGVDNFTQRLKNGENALSALKNASMEMAAQFLMDVAKMILKQIILNAMYAIAAAYGYYGPGQAGGGGSAGSFFGGAISSFGGGVQHSGGITGSTNRTRNVNPAMFAGATRYHTGGIAGLAPNEVPTILEKGEEVLTRDDPRHVLNQGQGQGGGTAATPQNITVNNHVDAESFMSAALGKPSGQKMILNVLSANKKQLKALVSN